MELDVASLKNLKELELKFDNLRKDNLLLIKQVDEMEHKIDLIVIIFSKHLSPIDLRKLKKVINQEGYFK